jgi:hypothetical protein
MYENRIMTPIKIVLSWVPVAPSCNPSFSGGRDQEDWNLKPARANSLRDAFSKKKKKITKKGLVELLKV